MHHPYAQDENSLANMSHSAFEWILVWASSLQRLHGLEK